MNAIARKHWIAEALEYFGLEAGDVPAGSSAADAWKTAEEASGLTLDELTKKIAAHFRTGIADLTAADSRALRLIPEKLARRYQVFPIAEDDRHIYTATSDPGNLEAEQAIAFASGRTPAFRIAAPSLINEAIDRRYSPDRLVEGLLARVEPEIHYVVRVLDDAEPEAMARGDIEAAPVVKLTNVILRDAARQGASDIHLEPSRDGGAVRFRVDGVLRPYMQLPIPALNRVVSRFKVLGRMDITDRLRPQDGRTRVQIEHHTYDLRLSTVPTRDSEKAVIRILDPGSSRSLEDLAMPAYDLNRFRRLFSNREGMILVTGPTGSGKTTTLYAALREIANGAVNVTTVEDPVEYELPGLTQIQVEPKRGVTFASALRSILRQDPDVIFVGEIRDLETATMAVQASMTGHLVLSTLHTNDAASVVARLADIGLDRASIAATLRGVVAQRLVRRVCPNCVENAGGKLDSEEERLAALYGTRPSVRARGCEQCGQSGYRGRIPLQEVLMVNSAMQDAITRGALLSELQQIAVAAGMRSLRSAGLARAAEGETTLSEIDRVLGDSGDQASAPPAIDQPQVLIVDDDAVNRRLARSILERQGYRVAEAGDGVAALERISTGAPFSLVLLDLGMPKMGGRELLTRLRSSVNTAGLPIMVLTSSADDATEAQLMEEGADDYIRKPLDPIRFVARVRSVLRRSLS